MSELQPINSYGRRALQGERLEDLPIIDHHGHLGVEPSGLSPEAERAEILATMDANAVDRAVVFGFGPDYRDVNDIVLEGMTRHPTRFIGYATIQMDSQKAAMQEIERCRRAGMAGLKLHIHYELVPYRSELFKPVWDFCAEHRWPVIIHGMDEQLPRSNPKTIFIAAHGIEQVNTAASLETMRECPNYYWCTSSTTVTMGAIEAAVARVGADRLLFGSDLPLNNQAVRMGSVLGARISDDDIRKIMGGNIARLLGIEFRKSFPM